MFVAIAELMEQYEGYENKSAAPQKRNQYSSGQLSYHRFCKKERLRRIDALFLRNGQSGYGAFRWHAL